MGSAGMGFESLHRSGPCMWCCREAFLRCVKAGLELCLARRADNSEVSGLGDRSGQGMHVQITLTWDARKYFVHRGLPALFGCFPSSFRSGQVWCS